MQVEILTREDLKQFKTELLDELKEALNSRQYPPDKPWLKSTEVRKLLNISPGTLQTLRINGTLRSTKVGGSLYYKYEDILKVLEENSH
ncbi:MAG TPA: helix-turn-helix domain-containing protein [Anseongella sp.]